MERQKSVKTVIRFWGNILSRSGGYSGVDTPVPIPNTEVKHSSGEDSLQAKQARCRVKGRHCLPFFFIFVSPLSKIPCLNARHERRKQWLLCSSLAQDQILQNIQNSRCSADSYFESPDAFAFTSSEYKCQSLSFKCLILSIGYEHSVNYSDL